MVLVFHKKLADDEHEHKTGQHHSHRGCQTAHQPPIPCIPGISNGSITHIGGTIDANRTRSTLAYGHYVGKLAHGHPMVMSDHFGLYHRYHGIASAKSEKAYAEERPEESEKQKNHTVVF